MGRENYREGSGRERQGHHVAVDQRPVAGGGSKHPRRQVAAHCLDLEFSKPAQVEAVAASDVQHATIPRAPNTRLVEDPADKVEGWLLLLPQTLARSQIGVGGVLGRWVEGGHGPMFAGLLPVNTVRLERGDASPLVD